MKTRHPLVGAAVAAATIIGLSGTAFAGEWAPGHGETPIKTEHRAASECAFSGHDQADATPDNPDGEAPGPEGPDDGLWGSTPAKGKAQSPGQLVAAFGPEGNAGVPGQACRGGAPAGD
jgi:hypothetical protein